ncbi:MAG: hypothetical protein JXK94_12320 [Deltaproteobacteria bacterium]|nr:hypothetical protein [Deltaproteobacteria bacterium]
MIEYQMQITGWLFIAAALMLWFGRVLLPVPIGVFFEPSVFPQIRKVFRRWIWLYRVHLFGCMVAVMAFVALGTLLAETSARILAWPATVVIGSGLFVNTLAEAFYYHFGAWGAQDMEGKSSESILAFIKSLQVSTEYVTCFTRFGRVFLGLGQIVLAIAMIYSGFMPKWVCVSGALLGFSGMGLTMALPDNLEYYRPLFHFTVLWLLALGGVLLM